VVAPELALHLGQVRRPHAARGHALERVDERRERDLTDPLPRRAQHGEDPFGDHAAAVLGQEDHVRVQGVEDVPTRTQVACVCHRPSYVRGVLVRKAFRFRVYPTPAQAARLTAWESALRWLWNLAHEQRRMGLGRPLGERRYPTAFDQINELKALRAEAPWLADVPRNVCAQLLVELDKAWQRAFKRLGRSPRWKRKGGDALGVCEPHPKVWRLGAEGLVFPKLGALKIVVHRPLEGTPKTCALVRDGDQWFACIVCDVELAAPRRKAGPTVALDRGVANVVADSDGRVVINPRHLDAMRPKLARAQRRLARTKKGSHNRTKAAAKVARLQRKVRRQRDHALHALSSDYAKSHGTVVVERLRIANLTASARGTPERPGRHVRQKAGLNRSILSAGWGRFVEMLRYKLAWSGGALVEVEPAYSSQTCAACGLVEAASRKSQAVFACVGCGHQDHADVNAAKVLKSRAVEPAAHVCGGDGAVGRPAKQKLRVARRGTVRKSRAQSPALQGGDGLPDACSTSRAAEQRALIEARGRSNALPRRSRAPKGVRTPSQNRFWLPRGVRTPPQGPLSPGGGVQTPSQGPLSPGGGVRVPPKAHFRPRRAFKRPPKPIFDRERAFERPPKPIFDREGHSSAPPGSFSPEVGHSSAPPRPLAA
jgi:putative transposase